MSSFHQPCLGGLGWCGHGPSRWSSCRGGKWDIFQTNWWWLWWIFIQGSYPHTPGTYPVRLRHQQFILLAISLIFHESYSLLEAWSLSFFLKSSLQWIEISSFGLINHPTGWIPHLSVAGFAELGLQVSPSKLHFQADVKRPRDVVFPLGSLCWPLKTDVVVGFWGLPFSFFLLGESNLPKNLW